MKQKIENLLKRIGKLMQEHLSSDEFDEVTALSPLLARVQMLQRREAEIESEVAEIESKLSASNGKSQLAPRLTEAYANAGETGSGRRQTLKIHVDWKANKRNKEPQEICENTAAASMAEFVSRVIEEFGQEALSKLAQVRINRGPLISKTPARDFLNHAQGKLYGHQKLRVSDYYILTHSPTDQKIQDLDGVCRLLGFIPGSVQIEKINRHRWFDGLKN